MCVGDILGGKGTRFQRLTEKQWKVFGFKRGGRCYCGGAIAAGPGWGMLLPRIGRGLGVCIIFPYFTP